MQIYVGSSNIIKVNAVKKACLSLGEIMVKGFNVSSGVRDQPRSDDETKLGSENRAKRALEAGMKSSIYSQNVLTVGIGMEGGVFEDSNGILWSTVWVTVIDTEGHTHSVNGARFVVPEPIASKIKAGGEMGPVTAEVVGVHDIKHKQGMIGVITNSYLDRTEEYSSLVKLAVGLWFGRDWYSQLEKEKGPAA